jgi:hypothetical protein
MPVFKNIAPVNCCLAGVKPPEGWRNLLTVIQYPHRRKPMKSPLIPVRAVCAALLICLIHVTAGAQPAGREKEGVRNPQKGKAAARQGAEKTKVPPVEPNRKIVSAEKEAVRTNGTADGKKGRFAGRVTVTVSPFAYQIFYIYLFSRKELDSGISQSRRTSEKLYPSKTNILYSGNIALDDILGTGASASFGYSGKYPKGFGVEDDTNSVIHDYGSRWFWPYFGLTAQWLEYRSFIRLSDRPDASYSKFSRDKGMEARSFAGNLYLRLFDLHGQGSNLQSILDPMNRDRFRLPFNALVFLLGSFDDLRVSSGSPLVTAPLQTAYDDMNFNEYRCRIYGGALMLGVKWTFWSNFFLSSSVAVVSAYRVEHGFMTPDGEIRETVSGIESIYSSMEKYQNFYTNPAESYTKQLLHAALGYRGDKFFCYGQYFWDVKNLKSEKVVVQYSTYDLKVALGAYF